MSSNKKTKNWKRVAFVIVLAAAAALAVPFLPGSLTGVFAQTEMNAGETDAETQTTPREMKDVRSQAPCTYTSVRGSNHPRFYALPPHSHG